jgi:hypothetical protein
MGNIGEARWKDGMYFTVRYAVPINSYGGELIFVVFMDGDCAIYHRSEINFPVQKKLYQFNDPRFFATEKARELLKKKESRASINESALEPEKPGISKLSTTYALGERTSNIEVFPSVMFADLINVLAETLSSKEMDPRGELGGNPLFDRKEPEISSLIASLIDLEKHKSIANITSEVLYPGSSERCDIVLGDDSGNSLWIEIKQSWEKTCTDWRTAFSLSEYFHDVEKLKQIPDSDKSVLLHLAYRPTSDFPDYFPVRDLMSALKEHPYEWRHFSMPTKDHGPCVCHLIAWLIQ